ncbi:MAG: hypothetical protein Q9226_004003 [Calogaya cf. arnoldii]
MFISSFFPVLKRFISLSGFLQNHQKTSNMDAIQGLDARYPGSSYEPGVGYLPGIAAFDYSKWVDHGYKANSKDTDSTELAVLRSKLAVAESRVEELRKDKDKAQNVIDYLLKQNAGVGFHGQSPCTPVLPGLPQYAQSSRAAGDVKAILSPIINLLHEIIRVDHSGRSPFAQSLACPCLGPANLLDNLDEGPRSGDKAKGPDDSSGHSSMLLGSPEFAKSMEASPAESAKDLAEQSDAREADLMFFEADASCTAPLVTRFRNVRNDSGSHQNSSEKTPSQPTAKIHNESLDVLQKSFDESETGLSGSTQYDASESALTNATSLNSSLQSSDDENEHRTSDEDEQQPHRHDIVEDYPARVKSKGTDEWDATTAASGAGDCDTSTCLSLSATPQPAITDLFLPKWSVLPYMMAVVERANAIMLHHRGAAGKEQDFPGFFKFGIRFRPNSTIGNVFRTVVVDNLPPKFAISTLLLLIKGGAVLDAKLLNTIGIHGRSSALITFVREQAAKAFEDQALVKPFFFDGLQARVVLLPTPTWPMASALQIGVLQHGHTRCLQVQNFPRSIKPAELEKDLKMCRSLTSHSIEAKRLRSDDVLELRFTSIKYAEIAWGIFTSKVLGRYRQCTCKFMPDPCAQPWEEVTQVLNCPPTHHEPCATQPENANSDATSVAAVTRWKEYAYETFTGSPTLAQAHVEIHETLEDRTCRLSEAEMDDAATVQRGRGFNTKQSVAKTDDTCSPQ